MPSPQKNLSFTAKPEIVSFDGFLFDMDGTIVDSTGAIVKHWNKLGKELGVDPEVILHTAHGRRSIDTFQLLDPSKANWEYVQHVEGLIPKEFGQDAVEVPGARELLAALEAANVLWAIVTSGTRPLLTGWLEVMKLSHPKNMVVAEDVKEGKPEPECYLLGKQHLGLSADNRVLVIEDSPAGIRAGTAAGCEVIGLVTTYGAAQVKAAGAHWVVKDLQSVKFVDRDSKGSVRIEIVDALESPVSL